MYPAQNLALGTEMVLVSRRVEQQWYSTGSRVPYRTDPCPSHLDGYQFVTTAPKLLGG